MAIFKNYYNRKPLGYIHKWCITVSCLYLLCVNHASAKNEKIRHHNAKPQEETSNRPLVTCPNCLYKHDRETTSADALRLEAIKRQILSKLGLRHKPNVTYAFPREIIMETLFRAEDSAGFLGSFSDRDEEISTTSARTENMDTVEADDFYGRTSEIISFAEQGYTVNRNRLLEFSVSAESSQAGQELRVRAATLWLKADFKSNHLRYTLVPNCVPTIYIFKFKSSLERSIIVKEKKFGELTQYLNTAILNENSTGWQKIDLTPVVREWLKNDPNERLRLFVDSACCTNWHLHIFNPEDYRKGSPNRPFLVIHTHPTTAKRMRRRSLECSNPNSGNQCCKERFWVSFKKLGWENFIIAPDGYWANYCRGDCGYRAPDSFIAYHTHVIEAVRRVQFLSGMQPCCAPIKFSRLSLIYVNNETIIKRDLPKMKVEECGCP